MSLVEAPPSSPPRGGPAVSEQHRRLRPIVAAAVAMALLLIAGGVFAIVRAVDAAALGQVHVFLDARPITCSDPSDVTSVARSEGFTNETYRVPAVRDVHGLDCVLAVVIRNDSDRDVSLQAITLPFFGPTSRIGIRSDRAQTQQSEPESVNDGRDVVYTWGADPLITLGDGDSFTYRLHLTSNSCRPAGSTFLTDAPIATVTTGTTTRDVHLEGAGFGIVGAATSAQSCH